MTAATPSIRDVAKAAGVSTATVSRTLTTPDRVREPTRQAVLRAIEDTGYRVNLAARNLRKRETGAIAVLVPNLANPFFSSILSGIAEVMSAAGYNVLVNDTMPSSRTDHRFPEFAGTPNVDGVIVLDGLIDCEALIDRVRPETRPPMVFACEWSDRLDRPRVVIDNEAAGASAVGHLLSLGHRRIGHLCGPPSNVLTKARLHGARSAMRAAGFEMHPGWVYPGDFSLGSGARAALAWCASTNRPSAVFCASDVMAIGFVGTLMRKGVTVPDAVSVVGFDDLDIASYFAPALTTIHQPRFEIGRAAAHMLLERMANPPDPRTRTPAPRAVMPFELIIRESTAPPPVEPVSA